MCLCQSESVRDLQWLLHCQTGQHCYILPLTSLHCACPIPAHRLTLLHYHWPPSIVPVPSRLIVWHCYIITDLPPLCLSHPSPSPDIVTLLLTSLHCACPIPAHHLTLLHYHWPPSIVPVPSQPITWHCYIIIDIPPLCLSHPNPSPDIVTLSLTSLHCACPIPAHRLTLLHYHWPPSIVPVPSQPIAWHCYIITDLPPLCLSHPSPSPDIVTLSLTSLHWCLSHLSPSPDIVTLSLTSFHCACPIPAHHLTLLHYHWHPSIVPVPSQPIAWHCSLITDLLPLCLFHPSPSPDIVTLSLTSLHCACPIPAHPCIMWSSLHIPATLFVGIKEVCRQMFVL